MEKPVSRDEPPDGHLPAWTHVIDGRVHQVKVTPVFVPLFTWAIVPSYRAVTQQMLSGQEYFNKVVEKCLLERAKILTSTPTEALLHKQELDDINLCLAGIQESRATMTLVNNQQLNVSDNAVGKKRKQRRGKNACAVAKTEAQESTDKAVPRNVGNVMLELHDVIERMQQEAQGQLQTLKLQQDIKLSSAAVPHDGYADTDPLNTEDVVNMAVKLVDTIEKYNRELNRKVEALKLQLQEVPSATVPHANTQLKDHMVCIESSGPALEKDIQLSTVDVNFARADLKTETKECTDNADIESCKPEKEMPQSVAKALRPQTENITPLQGPNLEEDGSVYDIKTKRVSELLATTEDEKDEDKRSDVFVLSTDVSSSHATPVPNDVVVVGSHLIDNIKNNEKEAERKLQLNGKCSSATVPHDGSADPNTQLKDDMETVETSGPALEKADEMTESKTPKEHISEEGLLKFSQPPRGNPTHGRSHTDLNVTLNEERAQGQALKEHKKQMISVPQKKTVTSSQKVQQKEKKKRRKGSKESPQQPCEKEKMVLSAVEEIWKVYELGQGPKNLSKLPDPRPSERYLKDNGQHLGTSIKDDYLKYAFQLAWMHLQKIYPKPSETQSDDSRTKSNIYKNINNRKHFSNRADFQDSITKEVLKQCGLQNTTHKNPHGLTHMVDELEFINVLVAERMFENELKKTNEKRYIQWMRTVHPEKCAIGVSEHSKGGSTLITPTVSGNVPGKDTDHQKPPDFHNKETEKATEEVLKLPKDGKLEAQQLFSTTEFSANTPLAQDECISEIPVMDAKGEVGDTELPSQTSAPSQQEEDHSVAAETGSDQGVNEERQSINKEVVNNTAEEAPETLKHKKLEAQQILFTAVHSSITTPQEEVHCMAAAMSSNQEVSEKHQSHQNTVNTEDEDEKLEAQQVLPTTDSSSNTSLVEFISEIPVMDAKGQAGYTESPSHTSTPSQQEKGQSAAADMASDQGGNEEHQSSNKEATDNTIDEQEEGHSTAAEMSSDQHLSEEHQSYQTTVNTEEVSELLNKEKLVDQQLVIKTKLSSSFATPQAQVECFSKGPEIVIKGHVGDTESTLVPTKQEVGHFAAAETASDREVSMELQCHNKEDTISTTEEVSELLKEDKLEVLSKTEIFSSLATPSQDELVDEVPVVMDTEKHLGDTESSLASPQQEVGLCAAVEMASGQHLSEEHQPYQTTVNKLNTQSEEATQFVPDTVLTVHETLADLPVTTKDHTGEKSLVRFSQQPRDDLPSIPQKKAITTKKSLHKDEKRRCKAIMDSPQHLSDMEEMVLSALQEIWDVCDLGRGPMDLAQLTAPCPSEYFLEIHGQHLKTLMKYDYLKYIFHFTWKILQELYPREPKIGLLSVSKTGSDINTNSSKQIPFGGTLQFQDNIAKAVLKYCRLVKEKQQNLQSSSLLLDEHQFLVSKVAENCSRQCRPTAFGMSCKKLPINCFIPILTSHYSPNKPQY